MVGKFERAVGTGQLEIGRHVSYTGGLGHLRSILRQS
jgi:hypothetical protein